MPSRQCIACVEYAIPGTSRCPQHSRKWRKTPQMQARSKLYDTRAWRERRKRQLEAEPYCRRCGRPAEIADHVNNVGAGYSFDGPLQSLCRPCHRTKTASEGGQAAKRNRRGFR